MHRLGILAVLCAVVACASSQQSGAAASGHPPVTSAASGESHGPSSAAHHPPMPPAMEAFHDVLRPLWHSDPGAERDQRTCAQSQTLRERAEALADAPAPAEVQPRASAWMTSSAQLVATTQRLESVCGARPPQGVASALEAVHTAFHNLLDLLRGTAR